MNPGDKDLLSIDVNGHLRKLAFHSHRSPHHYPVELIRSALERGATKVTVIINREKIEIQDNGRGIRQDLLDKLIALMDPQRPVEEREDAIQTLHSPVSIGLLSLFSPSPEGILIDDNSGDHSVRIQYNRKLSVIPNPKIPLGSRLEILRSSSDWEGEIAAVKDYCREVEHEIIVNRKPIEKDPVIQHPIASTVLNSTKYYRKSQISVTQEGDICKIWLTHQRIPWSLKTFPPIEGFVFDAVIETQQELSGPVFKQLSAAAANLYRWLCKRYEEYPESYRERIEDLLFKHNRLTGDDFLVNSFSPFRLLSSTYKFNLKEIQAHASSRGIPVLQKRYASRYSHVGGNKAKVLILNPKQIDFLGNHHHIPLRLIVPNKKEGKIRQWLARLSGWIKKTIRRLHPRQGRILDRSDLDPAEQAFLSILDTILSGDGKENKVEVVMIDSRGLVPSYRRKSDLKGIFSGAPTHTIFIPRHHPLIKQAVNAVEIDPANIELVLPALGIATIG